MLKYNLITSSWLAARTHKHNVLTRRNLICVTILCHKSSGTSSSTRQVITEAHSLIRAYSTAATPSFQNTSLSCLENLRECFRKVQFEIGGVKQEVL